MKKLALVNNLALTKKFLITTFDCIYKSIGANWILPEVTDGDEIQDLIAMCMKFNAESKSTVATLVLKINRIFIVQVIYFVKMTYNSNIWVKPPFGGN